MKKLLVSLDELLDTRLGFIALHNEEVAKRFVEEGNEEYFLRRDDSVLWESLGWTKQQWDEAWRQRDVNTLINSVVTHIPNAIGRIAAMWAESTDKAIADLLIEVDVNIYPYELTTDEKTELEDILSEILPGISKFRYVNYSLESLTYDFVKNEYGFVILYRFNDWLDLHGPSMKHKVMTQTQFFAPRLFKDKLDEDFLEKNPNLKKIWELDPFKITESIVSPKFGLTFIAASDFGPVLTRPVSRTKETQDLDYHLDQSGAYIPDSSLYDPQFQFPQE